MRIGFVGGGIMGEAIIAGILAKGIVSKTDIIVSEVSDIRRGHIQHMHGVETISDNAHLATLVDFIVLAIKPQSLDETFDQIRGNLKDQAVLSIIAGASLSNLSLGLDHGMVIRAMPNTPAQIGEGITVWTATADVTIDQRETARKVLSALGDDIYVADEKYLDMATAVSGSGPAYVFLFLEAMIDAGVHIGMPRDMATQLVFKTVLGSTIYAEKSNKHLAELKNMVMSPAGTTAAGLFELEKRSVRAGLIEAVVAAYERAGALGGPKDK